MNDIKSVKKIFVKGQTASASYKFEDSKVFTVKKVNSFTLIETDKPTYKPKDKGFFLNKIFFRLKFLIKNFFLSANSIFNVRLRIETIEKSTQFNICE